LPADQQADFHAILDLNLLDEKQFRTAVVRVFAVGLTHSPSRQTGERMSVIEVFLRDVRIQP
jgi:hypothetical protein